MGKVHPDLPRKQQPIRVNMGLSPQPVRRSGTEENIQLKSISSRIHTEEIPDRSVHKKRPSLTLFSDNEPKHAPHVPGAQIPFHAALHTSSGITCAPNGRHIWTIFVLSQQATPSSSTHALGTTSEGYTSQ